MLRNFECGFERSWEKPERLAVRRWRRAKLNFDFFGLNDNRRFRRIPRSCQSERVQFFETSQDSHLHIANIQLNLLFKLIQLNKKPSWKCWKMWTTIKKLIRSWKLRELWRFSSRGIFGRFWRKGDSKNQNSFVKTKNKDSSCLPTIIVIIVKLFWKIPSKFIPSSSTLQCLHGEISKTCGKKNRNLMFLRKTYLFILVHCTNRNRLFLILNSF